MEVHAASSLACLFDHGAAFTDVAVAFGRVGADVSGNNDHGVLTSFVGERHRMVWRHVERDAYVEPQSADHRPRGPVRQLVHVAQGHVRVSELRRQVAIAAARGVRPGKRRRRSYGAYSAATRVSDGGGHQAEGEDIEVVETTLDDAAAMIGTDIRDAKTIMLIQWALLNLEQLR